MKKIALLFAFSFALLIGGFSFAQINNEPKICYAEGTIQEEANDFISYWRSDVRGKYPDICSMSKEKYQEVYLRYVSLSTGAKMIVDNTIDIDNYSIKDTMTVLVNKFAKKDDQNYPITFNKSTTLTVIIVVGVLGMTSICGFYLLKTKNVIE